MNRIDMAENNFRSGLSCAQAILSTYGPDLGLDRETSIKVAGAFGAGMSRMGATCGAVTGALMVLGLTLDLSDPEGKDRVYDLGQEFCFHFREQNGSVICLYLMGEDVSTAEGRRIIKEKDLPGTICANLVRSAAEILEGLLSKQ